MTIRKKKTNYLLQEPKTCNCKVPVPEYRTTMKYTKCNLNIGWMQFHQRTTHDTRLPVHGEKQTKRHVTNEGSRDLD